MSTRYVLVAITNDPGPNEDGTPYVPDPDADAVNVERGCRRVYGNTTIITGRGIGASR